MISEKKNQEALYQYFKFHLLTQKKQQIFQHNSLTDEE